MPTDNASEAFFVSCSPENTTLVPLSPQQQMAVLDALASGKIEIYPVPLGHGYYANVAVLAGAVSHKQEMPDIEIEEVLRRLSTNEQVLLTIFSLYAGGTIGLAMIPKLAESIHYSLSLPQVVENVRNLAGKINTSWPPALETYYNQVIFNGLPGDIHLLEGNCGISGRKFTSIINPFIRYGCFTIKQVKQLLDIVKGETGLLRNIGPKRHQQMIGMVLSYDEQQKTIATRQDAPE